MRSETNHVPNTDQGRLTKAQRKEQARLEREEIQRKQASRARNRTIGIAIGVVVVVAAVGLVLLLGGGGGNDPGSSSAGPTLPDPATLPGILQEAPPWTNNTEQLPARLAMLSLPPLNDTVPELHHHVQLYIFVDGQPVVVPMNVGLSSQAASPLHTHDTTGLVHIESGDPNFFPVLGQFMDVWGPYFTDSCLGAECNQGNKKLRVYVNGQEYTGNPTLIPLTDLSTVAITFGTQAQLPNPIPSSFPSAG
jgi:hypothetical protein